MNSIRDKLSAKRRKERFGRTLTEGTMDRQTPQEMDALVVSYAKELDLNPMTEKSWKRRLETERA